MELAPRANHTKQPENGTMHLSKGYRRLMLATGLVATLAGSALAQAADTIKVGTCIPCLAPWLSAKPR